MYWQPLKEFRKTDGDWAAHTSRRKINGQWRTGKWYRLINDAPITIDTDIFIPGGDFVLAVGETKLIEPVIDGETPHLGAEFESSNPDAVSIDEDGLASGDSEGQAVITATTIEEPKRSHSITVSVGTYEFGTVSDTWTFET